MTINIPDEMAYPLLDAIQLQIDISYIRGNLYDLYEDGDDAHNVDIDRLRSDDEYAAAVARQYREFLEESYGSDLEWQCLKSAVKYINRREEILNGKPFSLNF